MQMALDWPVGDALSWPDAGRDEGRHSVSGLYKGLGQAAPLQPIPRFRINPVEDGKDLWVGGTAGTQPPAVPSQGAGGD